MDSGIAPKEQLENGHRLEIEEKRQTRSNAITFCKGRTKRERHLTLILITLLSIVVILSFVIASYVNNNASTSAHSAEDSSSFGEELPQAEALLKTTSDARISSSSVNSIRNVCLTRGCVEAAADIFENINEDADPCENFYGFACGNFVKYTIIPDKKSSVTMLTKIDDELREKLRIVIEEKEGRAKDSPATIFAKTLYNSCMEIDRIKEEGTEPLRIILKDYFGGWPVVEGESWNETNFSWVDVIYKSRDLGFTIGTLFNIHVQANLINSTKRILWVDQPYFILSREYLINGLNDTVVQAYLKYSIEVAKLLGADSSTAEEEMNQILQFQINLAKLSLSLEERRNITKTINFKTLKEMDELAPSIPWVTYINKYLPNDLEVNETEIINVGDVNYIGNMSKLLENTSKRILANFMIWRIASQAASYLSEDIRDRQFDYIKVLSGNTVRPPRWEECMTLVSDQLDFAIGNLYIKSYFKKEAKDQINELVAYVRAEFDNILRTITWMDDETREAALKKSKAMVSHIAYSEELLDDNKLTEVYKKVNINGTDSLLNNILNLRKFNVDYETSLLRETINKTDWKERPSVAQANAFYSFNYNTLEFPAGILQDRFFQPDRPKYLNFGAIGVVIGHEITHGFDDNGKKFDEEGKIRNWWDSSTEREFLERAKCIIDQYDSFLSPENGMKLNGINTQGENIADNGGLKEAYGAYQNWVKDHGMEHTLPGLKYTPNQLFWISNAQIWCSKYRPEYLKNMILTDGHSPGRFRILGPFRNSEEFAKDWKCPIGSSMNPKNKCVVW